MSLALEIIGFTLVQDVLNTSFCKSGIYPVPTQLSIVEAEGTKRILLLLRLHVIVVKPALLRRKKINCPLLLYSSIKV